VISGSAKQDAYESRYRIATVGDSVWEGYYANDGLGWQRYLLPLLPSIGARFVGTRRKTAPPFCPTDGKSGDTLTQIRARLSAIFAACMPSVVVLEGGINDALGGATEATIAATYAATLADIYALDPNVRVVACAITPIVDSETISGHLFDDAFVQRTNALYAAGIATDIAAGHRVVFCDTHTPISSVAGWQGTLIEPKDGTYAGLHPLDGGFAILGSEPVIFRSISTILQGVPPSPF